MEDLGVYVVTFNCARELVKPDTFAHHLFDALGPQPPDILIISLQEIAPIAYSFLGGSYLVPYFDRVFHAVKIAAASLGDVSYVHIITRNVGMTAIIAFVRQNQAQNIKWIETSGVGVGLYGMGNKGAVGLRIGYGTNNGDMELSAVAAHLAPMENALERRNKDWEDICRRLVFTPVNEGAVRSSRSSQPLDENNDDRDPLLQGDPDNASTPSSGLYTSNSHIILAGDLNYRTSPTKPSPTDHHMFPQPCEDQSNFRHYSNILKEDQLSRELKAQRTCHGLVEAPIEFPPTYKYSDRQRAIAEKDDGVMWDWSKHRWPSWCDRILYSQLPSWMQAKDASMSINVHGYTALPLMSTSDHRPVALSLSIPAIPISPPDHDGTGAEFRLSPPFDIDPDWRNKRAAARRRELIVGTAAFLSLTWEGRIALLATIIGAFGGWWIVRGLLES